MLISKATAFLFSLFRRQRPAAVLSPKIILDIRRFGGKRATKTKSAVTQSEVIIL